jgi:glycosyltransferase involved in cell wall biosynthesis
VRQRALCFSQLHARRLREQGLRGAVTVVRGLYAGDARPRAAREVAPLVMFAGRLIPEKRVTLAVAAIALAAQRIEGLRGVVFGDGPQRGALERAIAARGLGGAVAARGFADADAVEAQMGEAMCLLVTSQREGYGLVVVEAAARATPSVVVAGEDNAATELIEEGVNGAVAARADANAIADAIVRVHEAGVALRESTASWYAHNAEQLSLEHSLSTVLAVYAQARA